MRLTVFGATGKTGHEILRQGVTAGHEISVLARDPSRLGEFLPKVRVVRGDSFDSPAVEDAVAGSEAVLSVLGHVSSSPPELLSRSVANIVNAMRNQNVKRLVILTNMAARDPADRPGLYNRLLLSLLSIFGGQMARDTAREAKIVFESGLDWTIVRASLLTNGPLTKSYNVGPFDRRARTRISRANVAEFMISCVVTSSYIRAKPVISE